MENTIIITGRLGANPEQKDNGRGPYVRASLAHSQGHYDKQARQWVDADTPTAWFTITANGKTGDTLAAMHKGDMVMVVGSFSVDEWEPQDGTHAPVGKRTDLRIWANTVALIKRKQAGQQQAAQGYTTTPAVEPWQPYDSENPEF